MMQAAAILSSQRSEVLYDFHQRFHRDPDEFPRWKRSRLTVQLMRDSTSRTGAAVRGWEYAPSDVEQTFYERLDFELLVGMDPKARSNFTPIRRPWAKPVAADEPKQITPALRERLRKHVEGQNLGG